MRRNIFYLISTIFTLSQLVFSQTFKIHKKDGSFYPFNIFDIDSITFSSTGTVDTLVAYYPFNGNADDESGNGNHGGVFGATLTDDRFGNPNSAYYFDGIDDFIDIGNNSILKPQLPVSFSFWINYEVFDSRMPVFTNNYDVNDNYFGIWADVDPSNKIAIGYGDGGPIGPESRRTKRSSTITQNNVWYHIVGIIRGPQDMDIYINGVNDNGTYDGNGDSLAYNSNNAYIARQDASVNNPEDYFNGTIDELRFYNYVLSYSEIQALYTLTD